MAPTTRKPRKDHDLVACLKLLIVEMERVEDRRRAIELVFPKTMTAPKAEALGAVGGMHTHHSTARH